MPSPLTRLTQALEAKKEADAVWEPFDAALVPSAAMHHAAVERGLAHNRYHTLLTDDTIEALVKVAYRINAQHTCPLCYCIAPAPHDDDCPLASLTTEEENDDRA